MKVSEIIIKQTKTSEWNSHPALKPWILFEALNQWKYWFLDYWISLKSKHWTIFATICSVDTYTLCTQNIQHCDIYYCVCGIQYTIG